MSDVKLTYETCVYMEQVEDLTNDILAVLQKHIGTIGDDRVRNAMGAAALITAAQTVDQLQMPEKYRVNGVSGLMREMVMKWK